MMSDWLKLWIAPEADRFFLAPEDFAWPPGDLRIVSLEGVVCEIDPAQCPSYEVPEAIADYRIGKWQEGFTTDMTAVTEFLFKDVASLDLGPQHFKSPEALNAALAQAQARDVDRPARLRELVDRVSRRIGQTEAFYRAVPSLGSPPDLGPVRELVEEVGRFLVEADTARHRGETVAQATVDRLVAVLMRQLDATSAPQADMVLN